MTLLSDVKGFNYIAASVQNISGTIIDVSLGTAFYKSLSAATNFTFQNVVVGKTIVVTVYNSGISNYKVSFSGAFGAQFRTSSFMVMYGQIQTFSITFTTPNFATIVANEPINHRFGSTYGGFERDTNGVTPNNITVVGNSLYFCANISGNGRFTEPNGSPLLGAAVVDSSGSTAKSPIGFFTSATNTSNIFAIASDGNFAYFGGQFTRYKNQTVSNLVRINIVTGELDTGFSTGTGFNGNVNSLLIVGGSLYVGGAFTTYNGSTRQRILKLNKITGALDGTFNSASGFDGSVTCLAHDGTAIYAGGSFTTYNATGRQRVAKLDQSTATLDGSFNSASGANGTVNCILIYSGGLYIGGTFNTYAATARQGVAKINLTTAGLDGTFNSASGFSGGSIRSMVAIGTTLYCAGTFTTYGGASRTNLAALNYNTAVLDTVFNMPGSSSDSIFYVNIYSTNNGGNSPLCIFTNTQDFSGWNRRSSCKLVDQVSGQVINEYLADIATVSPGGAALGQNGEFIIGTTSGESFRRLNSQTYQYSYKVFKLDLLTGSLDRNFKCDFRPAGSSTSIYIRALKSDGVSLYVAGGPLYQFPYSGFGPGVANASAVWKVSLETGDVDPNFASVANFSNQIADPFVADLAIDGTTLYVAGVGINPLRALNKNTGAAVGGWTTPTFNTGSNDSRIFSIGVDSSGLYVAGNFSTVAGSSRNNIAKLNKSTGSLDATFAPGTGFNGSAEKILVSGSSIYASGFFSSYNGSSRTNMAKLDTTTAVVDATFIPAGTSFNNTPRSFCLSGGDIIVVGGFATFNGIARVGILKLNGTTGALDTTFNPGISFPSTNDTPFNIVDAGTRIFTMGAFTSYQGHPLSGGIAMIDPTTADIKNEFLPF